MFWSETAQPFLQEVRWLVLGWSGFAAALLTSAHVVLKKRDSRSAIAWIGLIWLSPFIGAFLYIVFGVNRIRTRAKVLRPRQEADRQVREGLGDPIHVESASLLRLGDVVTASGAVPGNRVQCLIDGEQAYPAMLGAIEQARFSVTLATYIFDTDQAGLRFADALEKAHRRGVKVRVLIDDVGSRYSRRSMVRELRSRGVPVARFLPILRLRSFFYLNMRLHRKLLVVDGLVAFTGGMNIREEHEVRRELPGSTHDLHFELRGPIVNELQKVFADDWEFATREALKEDEEWFGTPSEAGQVLARCVEDGPDLHLENARWILLGAIAGARKQIRIVTPYFVPDDALITALNTASMRGIRVQIVLPGTNNLPWVQWASQAILWQLLQRGCEVYMSPPPFDHSKVMTVDDNWAFFGSINWDARSLRLNFELNVEAYDIAFARSMNEWIDGRVSAAHRVTLEALDGRSLPVRLRDGVARLFSPYL